MISLAIFQIMSIFRTLYRLMKIARNCWADTQAAAIRWSLNTRLEWGVREMLFWQTAKMGGGDAGTAGAASGAAQTAPSTRHP
jgi:hypothetical protein